MCLHELCDIMQFVYVILCLLLIWYYAFFYVIYVLIYVICICYALSLQGVDRKVNRVWTGRSSEYGPEGQQSRTGRSTRIVGPEGP